MTTFLPHISFLRTECYYSIAHEIFTPLWFVLLSLYHDDVIKWKHFPRYWPFVRVIHRSPVNIPHKGQWRGALVFSLVCAWINGWAINGEAGDLRRHVAHYDVTVMSLVTVDSHICPFSSRLLPALGTTGNRIREHSGYGFSQWETTLHCNVVYHWLNPYTEWFLGMIVHANEGPLRVWITLIYTKPSQKKA